MKNTILCLLLILTSSLVFGQTAYIQVNGEADLSVFLNNQFKGKTTVELKGLIIEKVTPGKNLIKVVKEGYTPYEEEITVKPGEVFAYNVKPFTKHVVNVSQQGSSGETQAKLKIETGRLIVQSVPIEIKITMPDIEGVNNSEKTKDKWLADAIPTGYYPITFSFGQKIISKTVQIKKDSITSVFVNMLNGEFTVTFKEKPSYNTRSETIAYINQLLAKQGPVTYGLAGSYFAKSLQNKTDQHSFIYSSNSLSYSEASKSYTLKYKKNGVIWILDENSRPQQFNSSHDLSDTFILKAITFSEETCESEIISGSCLQLKVKSADGSVLRIRLPGKDPGLLSSLKAAFLYLDELDNN
jgi:hypothetical protein